MTDLDDLKARVDALAPNDFAAFRAWFFTSVGTFPDTWRKMDRVRRPASDYETFDPQAYDDETEAYERTVYERWVDDLRALKTEAQVLAAEEASGRKPPSLYGVFQEQYEAEHPRPGLDASPAECAAWDWAYHDAMYEFMDSLEQLARHRNEKGAYIARHTEMHANSRAYVDALFGPLKSLPPRTAQDDENPEGEGEANERAPWPPDDPEADLKRFWEVADPDDLADTMWLRETYPAYARADDLHAGAFGWMMSLPKPRPEGFSVVYEALRKHSREMMGAAEASWRPGHIGATLLRLKRALPLADEILLRLDEVADEAWVTPAAYRRLSAMTTAARDALLDHYVDARAHYAALRDVADRVLGSVPDPEDEAGGGGAAP